MGEAKTRETHASLGVSGSGHWASHSPSPSGQAHPSLQFSDALGSFFIHSHTPLFFLRPYLSLPILSQFLVNITSLPTKQKQKVPRKTILIQFSCKWSNRGAPKKCFPNEEPFFPPRATLSCFPSWHRSALCGSKVKGPREGMLDNFKGNAGRRTEWESGKRGIGDILFPAALGMASSPGYRKSSFPPWAWRGFQGTVSPANTGSRSPGCCPWS